MKFVPRLFNLRILRVGWHAVCHAMARLMSGRRWLSAVAIPVILFCGWQGQAWLSARRVMRPASVSAEEWAQAEATCRRNRGGQVQSGDILMTLARQAGRRGDTDKAFACYEEIATDDPRHGLQATFEYSMLLLEQNFARRAETGFLTLLQHEQQGASVPSRQLLMARQSLSLLYGLQMRLTERAAVLRQLISERQADLYAAKYYYFPSLMIWQNAWGAERITEFLSREPQDVYLQAAAARYLTGEGQPALARNKLLELQAQEASNLDLTAWLLESCFELNDWATFERTYRQLPAPSATEPILLTQMRGEWCLHAGRWSEAEMLLRDLLTRDAANSQATMGLARALEQSGRLTERDECLRRAAVIADLRVGLTVAHPGQTEALTKVSRWCRELQMNEAAETFGFFAAMNPGPSSPGVPGLPQ